MMDERLRQLLHDVVADVEAPRGLVDRGIDRFGLRERRRRRTAHLVTATCVMLVLAAGVGMWHSSTGNSDTPGTVDLDVRGSEPAGESEGATTAPVPTSPTSESERSSTSDGSSVTIAANTLVDPVDLWTTLPPMPIEARSQASVVWIGSEVLVWGGEANMPPFERLNDGAA